MFIDHPERFQKRKLLPLNPNALDVIMKISLVNGKLWISTNLYEGAKLFIVGRHLEKNIIVQKDERYYDLSIPKDQKTIEGEVILLTPSLQSESFLEKAGIDFEKLTGDFIKRSSNLESLICGVKKFKITL